MKNSSASYFWYKKVTVVAIALSFVINLFLLGLALAQDVPAKEETQKYLKSSYEASDAYYRKGLEYAAGGNFKEAQEQFTKALETNKFNLNAQHALETIGNLNKGVITKEYALVTFTVMLVKLELHTLKERIEKIESKFSSLQKQAEESTKGLDEFKEQFERDMFYIRIRLEDIWRKL